MFCKFFCLKVQFDNGLFGMWLYTFKSQFVSITKESGHKRCDYKGSLLSNSFLILSKIKSSSTSLLWHYCMEIPSGILLRL
jgi:hypothetical protein